MRRAIVLTLAVAVLSTGAYIVDTVWSQSKKWDASQWVALSPQEREALTEPTSEQLLVWGKALHPKGQPEPMWAADSWQLDSFEWKGCVRNGSGYRCSIGLGVSAQESSANTSSEQTAPRVVDVAMVGDINITSIDGIAWELESAEE